MKHSSKFNLDYFKKMKIFKYLIVGATACLVDFLLFFTLVNFFSLDWPYAASLSFISATVLNYRLSITYIFASGIKFKVREELLLIFLVSIFGLILTQCFIYVFYNLASINLFFSKVITTGIVFFWNYSSRRYIVFK
jgi:putative flippase GtrA